MKLIKTKKVSNFLSKLEGSLHKIKPPPMVSLSRGDDPNEVKARLKMWAQAVALASASR